MKLSTKMLLTLCLFSTIFCIRGTTANPYASDANVRHSLFNEKDSKERMSVYAQGVPMIKQEDGSGDSDRPGAEEIIAKRIVIQYKKIFDYLDFIDVDDLLDAKELSVAFRDFNWPKMLAEGNDDIAYADMIVQTYDTTKSRGKINFEEFCKFMEDLWSSTDILQEQRCTSSFNNSLDMFRKLFKWLDRDQDKLITPEDMIYGISRIMIRDADLSEIQTIFSQDAKAAASGKLTEESFILAVVNGLLDKTFKDVNFSKTFSS